MALMAYSNYAILGKYCKSIKCTCAHRLCKYSHLICFKDCGWREQEHGHLSSSCTISRIFCFQVRKERDGSIIGAKKKYRREEIEDGKRYA
nr:hypothetical protein CFP56_34990 [Quercus suber]